MSITRNVFFTGFTPLILAATAGHVDVVEILLESGADMEAQSERTKDTPLSLACSGGRYEVNFMTLYHDLFNIVMLLFCFQSKYADALGKIKKILTCT